MKARETTENQPLITCIKCGKRLEPDMEKCPNCGSKDRIIRVRDGGVGKDAATVNALITVEDSGKGEDMASISSSLVENYGQLSSSFTDEQKKIADALQFFSKLDHLKTIAESDKRLVELAKEGKKQAEEEAKRQRKLSYITIGVAFGAIIVAVLLWVFPR